MLDIEEGLSCGNNMGFDHTSEKVCTFVKVVFCILERVTFGILCPVSFPKRIECMWWCLLFTSLPVVVTRKLSEDDAGRIRAAHVSAQL